MKFGALLGVWGLLIGFAGQVAIADEAPDCLDNNGNALSVMDSTVIQWKTSTPNEWKSRALVTGTVDQIFPDATGHHHFEITLDASGDWSSSPNSSATLEVVYNEGFGATPQIQVGDSIEACGDYITSYEQGGGYQASPSGALIHWIHQSDTPKHPNGFLMVNGVLYGNLGG
jgi:hypothetical protein